MNREKKIAIFSVFTALALGAGACSSSEPEKQQDSAEVTVSKVARNWVILESEDMDKAIYDAMEVRKCKVLDHSYSAQDSHDDILSLILAEDCYPEIPLKGSKKFHLR